MTSTNDFSQSSSPPLAAVQTGLFVRSLTLARLAFIARNGTKAGCRESQADLQTRLEEQAAEIARELGRLKGSAMKVGQLLSVYGERLLPPQVNSLLKCLQSNAPPLEWRVIERRLQEELGDRLDELEVNPVPIAAASIGQVHAATVKTSGQQLALKIQYPSVERAVLSDLRALKTMATLGPLLLPGVPGGLQLDDLFNEIDAMLKRELDYEQEADSVERYRLRLKDDSRFAIPRVHHRWTTSRVLAVDRICGHRFDSEEVQSLSLERRNRLAQALLELYLRELFEFGFVQTDPHVGNYRVRLAGETTCDGQAISEDTVVLIDFGAVREFTPPFLELYRRLIGSSYRDDRQAVLQVGLEIGFLLADDPVDLQSAFYDFCRLVVEPFNVDADATYDWRGNCLPERLARQLTTMIGTRGLRAPPAEVLFLDRKSSGLYVLLGVLGAKTMSRPLLEKALQLV